MNGTLIQFITKAIGYRAIDGHQSNVQVTPAILVESTTAGARYRARTQPVESFLSTRTRSRSFETLRNATIRNITYHTTIFPTKTTKSRKRKKERRIRKTCKVTLIARVFSKQQCCHSKNSNSTDRNNFLYSSFRRPALPSYLPIAADGTNATRVTSTTKGAKNQSFVKKVNYSSYRPSHFNRLS